MELKLMHKTIKGHSGFLLIEPLWNWNNDVQKGARRQSYSFNRTTMELKHAIGGEALAAYFSFNRTTMELKPRYCQPRHWWRFAFNRTTMELKRVLYDYLGSPRLLLIEPLWNWNHISSPTKGFSISAFNRTTMELKLAWKPASLSPRMSFNRTTMELKRLFKKVWHGPPPSF